MHVCYSSLFLSIRSLYILCKNKFGLHKCQDLPLSFNPSPPPNMNQQNTVCSQKCFSTRNREISTAHSFPFLLLPQFFLSPLPPQFLSQLSALTPSLPLLHPTPSLSSFSFLLLPLSYLPQRLLSPLLQQHVLKL